MKRNALTILSRKSLATGGAIVFCVTVTLACGGATSSVAPPPAPSATASGTSTSTTSNDTDACSKQYRVAREDFFWGTVGARGKIDGGGASITGWTLFDTGASYTRVRQAGVTTGDDTPEQPGVYVFRFGNWIAQSKVHLSPALNNFSGPSADGHSAEKGTQIATVGSELMSAWSVRFAPDAIYFSEDAFACSKEKLRSQGLHAMSSAGYYQRSGSPADVHAQGNVGLVIPTVNARIMGHLVPVQIDTGYDAPPDDLQIQINNALFNVLRDQLGPSTKSIHINNFDLPWYRPAGTQVEFIDSDTHGKFSTVSDVSLLVKPSLGGGIAQWNVPAAMISGRVFLKAFREMELRADQGIVWASPPQ